MNEKHSCYSLLLLPNGVSCEDFPVGVCCLSLYRASHTFTLKVRIHCYGYSCVYNSCRDGCNVDDRRLTGDASSQANTAVSNSVGLNYSYPCTPCYRIHMRQLFVFAVWPILIALCIARHLISWDHSDWKWPQMAPDSPDMEAVIWYRAARRRSYSCWPCLSSSRSFAPST